MFNAEFDFFIHKYLSEMLLFDKDKRKNALSILKQICQIKISKQVN